MKKICPRCKNAFECREDNITKCTCSKIDIPNDVYEYIKEKYSDCLCIKCLKEIKMERQGSPKLSAAPEFE